MNRVTLPVASLLVAVACTARGPAAASALISAGAFVPLLEHAGARVLVAEQMPRDFFAFFSVTARRLLVNGQSVHVSNTLLKPVHLPTQLGWRRREPRSATRRSPGKIHHGSTCGEA